MKKLLCITLVVVLSFLFAACFADDPPAKESAKITAAKEENEDIIFHLNESAVFKDLKFTATEIKESNGNSFFMPEAGNIFVGIKFTIENISNQEQAISTLLLFEGYADDIKISYSLNAACAYDEGTLDGTVAAGKKLVGWYALEVPENWKNIELHVQSTWLSNHAAKFTFNK